jgi:predicted amidohydrolase YtcJ
MPVSAYNAGMRSYLLVILVIAGGATAAETAIHNVTAYTSTETGIVEFEVLVLADSGRIIAAGGPELLAEHATAERIDGGGNYLLPGLIDAHAHMSGLGFLAINLDLAGSPSLDDAVNRIADHAAANPHVDWIEGRGWNQVLWHVAEFPTAGDIDRVVGDRPVWLQRVDGHAGWANSATLRLAGIDDDTLDPVGGKILRDKNGHATGVLIDRAMDLVNTHVPAPTKVELRDAFLQAIATLLPLGITGVHDAGIDIDAAEVYMALADDAALTVRVYAMLANADANLDAMGKPLLAYGNDHLDIRSVKIYADGALGSRGAALLEPYSDDAENRGLAFVTGDELYGAIDKANRMGFQVGVHAIGDRGNRLVLDAFERVQHGQPSPLRNRIEHAQIIALDDIPRFATLGVIAAMQPTHATSDMNMAEDRVGPERIRGGYAWRRLLSSGAVIASGSDFPVELPNPFHGLYAAVSRQDRDGMPAGGWYTGEAMSREQALHSFTLAAAYAAHQEDRLGSLEPGKWADFILVDRDYFKVPTDQIDDIQVLETWIGGQRVYQRQSQ